MYSTQNEDKSVVAERFIRTLKIKFRNSWLQYQKVCILITIDDIVNELNNKYHRTIKMKSIKVKDIIYILTLVKKLMIKILDILLVII